MWMQRLAAILCIAIPAAALASMGCGIVALPVSVPMIIVHNARHLQFDVSIVDETGAPMDHVDVQATRIADQFSPFFVVQHSYKSDSPRRVKGGFHYDTFGNFGVEILYQKEGYSSIAVMYTNQDKPLVKSLFLGSPEIFDQVNIKREPHSTVMMKRSGTPR